MAFHLPVAGPLAAPAAATSHALARAADHGEFSPPALADLEAAAAVLGRTACDAGLEFDDLLALVSDLAESQRGGAPHAAGARDDEPQAVALLLYLWRVTGHAYQAAVVERARRTPNPRRTPSAAGVTRATA